MNMSRLLAWKASCLFNSIYLALAVRARVVVVAVDRHCVHFLSLHYFMAVQ